MNLIDTAATAAASPDLRPSPGFPEALARTPVEAGPGALQAVIRAHFPSLDFREVARRGGWHRPGGVIDGHHRRIAAHLQDWLAAELAGCDDDLEELAEIRADADLFATRLAGTTLYLVADTGPAADAFLQLEIEILQESLGALLFGTPVDEDAQTLIDRCTAVASGPPVDGPRYVFRRLIDIEASIGALRARAGLVPPTVRFVDEWTGSSAHGATTLGRHWLMQVSEHLDRFRQMQLHVKPLSATIPAQRFADADRRRAGAELHQSLMAFDRQAGHPMAWFFNMVATHTVPSWVATAVIEDYGSGFRYLPERDVEIVRNWLHRPYAP